VSALAAFLETTAGLMAFLLSLSALLGGAAAWGYRRVKAISIDTLRDAMAPHADTRRKVEHIEAGLQAVKAEVGALRLDHGQIARRITSLEHVMEGVARKEDLHALTREFVEFRGATSKELDRNSGMLDTVYRAILRASKETDQ
jgi:hypothetical protein